MNILVLGGGAQGRVIATDLATPAAPGPRHRRRRARPAAARAPQPGVARGGLLVRRRVVRLMREHDFAVGALPSRFGFAAMKAAIEAKRNLVDVSFCAEDALDLDAAARAAGVTIIPDAGLAPGISNLVAGEAYARRGAPRGAGHHGRRRGAGPLAALRLLRDLVARRPDRGVRPARRASCRADGRWRCRSSAAWSDVAVEGVGEMEAFYSDGLRSLMDTLPGVPEMGEKTLRWPGHVEAVKPLVAAGPAGRGVARALHARPAAGPGGAGGARALGRRRRAGARWWTATTRPPA